MTHVPARATEVVADEAAVIGRPARVVGSGSGDVDPEAGQVCTKKHLGGREDRAGALGTGLTGQVGGGGGVAVLVQRGTPEELTLHRGIRAVSAEDLTELVVD